MMQKSCNTHCWWNCEMLQTSEKTVWHHLDVLYGLYDSAVSFLGICISLSCYNKHSINWGAYIQKFISHSAGGWIKIKVLAGLVSGEVPLSDS